jgi:hypothetical protein
MIMGVMTLIRVQSWYVSLSTQTLQHQNQQNQKNNMQEHIHSRKQKYFNLYLGG